LSGGETRAGYTKVVNMFPEKGEIVIKRDHIDEAPKVFTFDAAYNEDVMQ
jgi:hypothetical protein